MHTCECQKVAPKPYKSRPDKTLSKGWRNGQNYLNRQPASRITKSSKDEQRKIKQNQREFYKAYEERFGLQTPFSRIKPNPKKKNPSYNLIRTSSKRQIPYDSLEERKIRQQQIDFIREYERKAREEELAFEDLEQQNRIRQQQLDFIKEFDRKLKEEQDAIDAEYEESVRRRQFEFVEKYEEDEAAKKASGSRSTEPYARRVGYDRIKAEIWLRKRNESSIQNMKNCMYRFCCRVYCCVTVVFIIAVLVFAFV